MGYASKNGTHTTPSDPKSVDLEAGDPVYWYPERNAKLNYVRRGYFNPSNPMYVCLLVLVLGGLGLASVHHARLITLDALMDFWNSLHINLLYLNLFSAAFTAVLVIYWARRPLPIHLLDFSIFYPDEETNQKWQVTYDWFNEHARASGFFTPESLTFQEKLLKRNSIGESCLFPPSIKNFQNDLPGARQEAELVLFPVLDELFQKTGIVPKQVDVLVVNCSLFCPTPSIASMIIHHYKMRTDIQSYNLGGMGCSAGVIAVHLAKDLLQVYRGKRALVVSTENITQNWYTGNEKGMLITNTLFRAGGAAVMLSSRSQDRWNSKFTLLHTVRTHVGNNTGAYQSVWQDTDKDGKVGVRLSKDIIGVAGEAIKTNLTTLGPLILPVSEQVKFFINLIKRKYLKKKIPPYTPAFSKAVQHFCIHTGGRAVLDAMQQNLQLDDKHIEPSRATLWRWGNTSSASIWYELSYIEQKCNVRRGDKVWQIAFGSGFKCNSAVWQANYNNRAGKSGQAGRASREKHV